METYRKINLYFPWPLKACTEHGKPKQKLHYPSGTAPTGAVIKGAEITFQTEDTNVEYFDLPFNVLCLPWQPCGHTVNSISWLGFFGGTSHDH